MAIEWSLAMHPVAIASAAELTPRAPLIPSSFTNKYASTTRVLRGIPKRLRITDFCSSGTYLLLSVPIAGKYIPTQASYRQRAPIIPARLVVAPDVR